MYYEEFMQAVRGQLGSYRKQLVDSVFYQLDHERLGELDVNAIKSAYNARNHPDVRAGKLSEDGVLGEFIETLEMCVDLIGAKKRQIISIKDFEDYYAFVSICIEDDKTFDQQLTAVWKSHPEEIKPAYSTRESAAKSRPLSVTQAAPYGTTEVPTDYASWKRSQGAYRPGEGPVPAGYPSGPKYEKHEETAPQPKSGTPEKKDMRAIEGLRQTLMARGPRGVIGLYRALRIADTGMTGRVGFVQLAKVLREYRVKIPEDEVKLLFQAFDFNGTGAVDYSELVDTVVVLTT